MWFPYVLPRLVSIGIINLWKQTFYEAHILSTVWWMRCGVRWRPMFWTLIGSWSHEYLMLQYFWMMISYSKNRNYHEKMFERYKKYLHVYIFAVFEIIWYWFFEHQCWTLIVIWSHEYLCSIFEWWFLYRNCHEQMFWRYKRYLQAYIFADFEIIRYIVAILILNSNYI